MLQSELFRYFSITRRTCITSLEQKGKERFCFFKIISKNIKSTELIVSWKEIYNTQFFRMEFVQEFTNSKYSIDICMNELIFNCLLYLKYVAKENYELQYKIKLLQFMNRNKYFQDSLIIDYYIKLTKLQFGWDLV